MKKMTYTFLILGLASACSAPEKSSATTTPDVAATTEEAGHHDMKESGKEPFRTLEDGSELYGAEFTGTGAEVELATLIASPNDYDGKVVKTSGEVTQVCKKMGCWMEMRASKDGAEVRVPMAGHSFFLPRTVTGRSATIEGTVSVKPLSEEVKKHLEEEGAKAADQEVSISATSVHIHPKP